AFSEEKRKRLLGERLARRRGPRVGNPAGSPSAAAARRPQRGRPAESIISGIRNQGPGAGANGPDSSVVPPFGQSPSARRGFSLPWRSGCDQTNTPPLTPAT